MFSFLTTIIPFDMIIIFSFLTMPSFDMIDIYDVIFRLHGLEVNGCLPSKLFTVVGLISIHFHARYVYGMVFYFISYGVLRIVRYLYNCVKAILNISLQHYKLILLTIMGIIACTGFYYQNKMLKKQELIIKIECSKMLVFSDVGENIDLFNKMYRESITEHSLVQIKKIVRKINKVLHADKIKDLDVSCVEYFSELLCDINNRYNSIK